MNVRTICAGLLFSAVASCASAQNTKPSEPPFDPTKEIESAFPKSIEIKSGGRILEFCPDETCDGFVASREVSIATLKDFAYLYVYFFSDYLVYLPEWRPQPAAKATAERVLSKPEYHSCKNGDSREAARCVLRSLSRNGRVKLIFVRYDEGLRNVVPENIDEELAEKKPASKKQ